MSCCERLIRTCEPTPTDIDCSKQCFFWYISFKFFFFTPCSKQASKQASEHTSWLFFSPKKYDCLFAFFTHLEGWMIFIVMSRIWAQVCLPSTRGLPALVVGACIILLAALEAARFARLKFPWSGLTEYQIQNLFQSDQRLTLPYSITTITTLAYPRQQGSHKPPSYMPTTYLLYQKKKEKKIRLHSIQ